MPMCMCMRGERIFNHIVLRPSAKAHGNLTILVYEVVLVLDTNTTQLEEGRLFNQDCTHWKNAKTDSSEAADDSIMDSAPPCCIAVMSPVPTQLQQQWQ